VEWGIGGRVVGRGDNDGVVDTIGTLGWHVGINLTYV
jgi:hypothetical protein